ncbi:MAG: class I SAM-dependent methyltransferase [Dehalococcoidia bacterium]|nr:class I SAM-dependent methyltransferase [Dehalococcoidia bacterium]
MTQDDAAPYLEANRAWWDHVVPIHEASRGYDREGFLRGEKPLCPVELEELGPHVEGRSLLHLQCHFGMDTLNWARLGARVTGLDFAPQAIEAARRLSEDSGVPGRFVEANVYDAPTALEGERFDLVYTGIGALNWLPDIRAWAQVVTACLRDGGRLYLYEAHPALYTLDEEQPETRLVVRYPYFPQPEPLTTVSTATYVDGPALPPMPTHDWIRGLGEIVTALIEAGLVIEFLHEHREMPWQALPWMEFVGDGPRGADGRYQSGRMWRLPAAQRELVPLMYSLMARRPASD